MRKMIDHLFGQDFHKIREELLLEGKLFEDVEFPATNASLFFNENPVSEPFQWRRPDKTKNPQLFVDGSSRFDVQQGVIGDCWMVAALANVTLYDKLFAQVVPDDQSFGEDYAGIFHFRFWQYGRWVDVVVDDRLPTFEHDRSLVFLHSSTTNEFWSALLEKAYAKLHGSYEALDSGLISEAMEDFTGGVSELYEIKEAPSNLYKIMLKAFERSSLMGCSISADPIVVEDITKDGLVKGHAYSITSVKYVDVVTPNSSGKIPLIRLRNPWGNETEWNGAWSDKSPEWQFIPNSAKEDIEETLQKEDGEFWMSFKDFSSKFVNLEICHLGPTSFYGGDVVENEITNWKMSIFNGEWVRNSTAGGCINFSKTFCYNPQYIIQLEKADDDDDDGACTVILSLMQKSRRSMKNKGLKTLTIGYALLKLAADPQGLPKPLTRDYLNSDNFVAPLPGFLNFISLRGVTCRYKLLPGSYCIVPSTYKPNEAGQFVLRVFSENSNKMELHDEEIGLGAIDRRIFNVPLPGEIKTEQKLQTFFYKIAGEDKEVDWLELKQVLDYALRTEIKTAVASYSCGIKMKAFRKYDTNIVSKDMCRSLIAMNDVDRSGKLGYEEFKSLWKDINKWRDVFRLYDKDGSKCLSAFELRQALNSAGYIINNHILNILAHRYSTKDGLITFDDFMMCTVRLKAMIDVFQTRDPNTTQLVTFAIDDWIEKTMYS